MLTTDDGRFCLRRVRVVLNNTSIKHVELVSNDSIHRMVESMSDELAVVQMEAD